MIHGGRVASGSMDCKLHEERVKCTSSKIAVRARMQHKIAAWITKNKTLIIVTFEVFWILVFLLDRVTSTNSVDIPQFIYVQF